MDRQRRIGTKETAHLKLCEGILQRFLCGRYLLLEVSNPCALRLRVGGGT